MSLPLIPQFTMAPVETEYYDPMRYAITSGGKCLTRSSTNARLGIAVDVHASAIGIAWNDTTMGAPGLNSPKFLDLNRLTRRAVRLHRYPIVPGGNGSI